ncbi:hypothetical protein AFLA_001530 [Aspergillus flavus NRRL3357]|nr:hypothetical protein AFLA_001530 [Aspergillus flavus NRRL3357]
MAVSGEISRDQGIMITSLGFNLNRLCHLWGTLTTYSVHFHSPRIPCDMSLLKLSTGQATIYRNLATDLWCY